MAKPIKLIVALEPQLPNACNVDGSSNPSPSIDMIVPELDLHHSNLRKKILLQLEDDRTLRDDIDLVIEVADRITSWRDKGIVIETAGDDILLDRIQKALMVSIILT